MSKIMSMFISHHFDVNLILSIKYKQPRGDNPLSFPPTVVVTNNSFKLKDSAFVVPREC